MSEHIVEIDELQDLLILELAIGRAIERCEPLRLWIDRLDDGAKHKVGAGTWSPPYGTVVDHG